MLTDLSFGEWLKRQRMGRGLTREQLADQIGCAVITLRKIESEERRPSAQIAERIADIFNIPKNERKKFISFTRGDYTKAPPEQNAETPWQNPTLRTNLRVSLTSFIGRDQEVADVRAYVSNPDTRLITLLGPPGIGKTRLSLAVARASLSQFSAGVFFVELAPLEDPNLVALTLAQTLNITEASDRSPFEKLRDEIGDKHMLIVLDNVEHVLDTTATLASDLLSTCPRLTILTTTREAIRSPGEWLYPVPALTIPTQIELTSTDIEALSDFSALKLFAERGRAARPDFTLNADNAEAVTAICAQLDGLPLAIELIAARIRWMSAQTLLSQLTDQFVLSADGMRAVPARQKKLFNAIGWSYDSLPEQEQILFRHLGVFAGGWTLEEAQAICSDTGLESQDISPTLTRLLEKSLVFVQEQAGQLRYQMLVTIRQYANEKLSDTHETEATHNRHLDFFLKLAEETEPKLHGPTQAESLERMEIEMDNFRTALRWGLTHNKESGVLLTGTLWLFWFMHAHFMEARQWYEEALSIITDVSPHTRMKLMIGAASNVFGRGDKEQTAVYSEQSLALAHELNDTWGIAMSLHHLGATVMDSGDFPRAQLLLEEGLQIARTSEHWAVTLYILDDIGNLARRQNNFKQAEIYFNEMRDLSEQHAEKWIKSYALACLSSLAYAQKEFIHAQTLTKEALMMAVELNDKRQLSQRLGYLGIISIELGEAARAAQLLGAAKQMADSIDVIFDTNEQKINDLKSQLGKSKFEVLFSTGQALSMEEAIALALQ